MDTHHARLPVAGLLALRACLRRPAVVPEVALDVWRSETTDGYSKDDSCHFNSIPSVWPPAHFAAVAPSHG